jgi:cell division protein FtsL
MTSRRVKNNSKWILFKLVFAACLIIGLFVLVGLRASVVNLEYELAELNRQKVALVRTSKLLVAQRASYYSASNVEDAATGKLGMQFPERGDVFYLKRGSGASVYKVSLDSGSGGSSRLAGTFWK